MRTDEEEGQRESGMSMETIRAHFRLRDRDS